MRLGGESSSTLDPAGVADCGSRGASIWQWHRPFCAQKQIEVLASLQACRVGFKKNSSRHERNHYEAESDAPEG